jgi:hypothetical protein
MGLYGPRSTFPTPIQPSSTLAQRQAAGLKIREKPQKNKISDTFKHLFAPFSLCINTSNLNIAITNSPGCCFFPSAPTAQTLHNRNPVILSDSEESLIPRLATQAEKDPSTPLPSGITLTTDTRTSNPPAPIQNPQSQIRCAS